MRLPFFEETANLVLILHAKYLADPFGYRMIFQVTYLLRCDSQRPLVVFQKSLLFMWRKCVLFNFEIGGRGYHLGYRWCSTWLPKSVKFISQGVDLLLKQVYILLRQTWVWFFLLGQGLQVVLVVCLMELKFILFLLLFELVIPLCQTQRRSALCCRQPVSALTRSTDTLHLLRQLR